MRQDTLSVPTEEIVFSKITKRFGEHVVFDGLDLRISATGITALMGPSGCGKTTLLSLLLGLEAPDAGTVSNPHTAISCAFQDPRLVPWLNATENVALVLTGQSNQEKNGVAVKMLSRLGLADAVKKLPAELSGGMQQRVSLARAFVAPHTLLLLDEPFRGLDEENKRTVCELIRTLGEDRSVLLVTHDEGDVAALGATLIRL